MPKLTKPQSGRFLRRPKVPRHGARSVALAAGDSHPSGGLVRLRLANGAIICDPARKKRHTFVPANDNYRAQ